MINEYDDYLDKSLYSYIFDYEEDWCDEDDDPIFDDDYDEDYYDYPIFDGVWD
jgi:hypothetical protein